MDWSDRMMVEFHIKGKVIIELSGTVDMHMLLGPWLNFLSYRFEV